jgi:Uma2 family endonuclease
MTTTYRPTIDDLYSVPEKAELVNGEIITMPPTGYLPGYAGGEIFASLREYAKAHKKGIAVPDNVGFTVDLPDRQSFSPDAAYYTGLTAGMKFLEGAPVFAAEIRRENDYGAKAERDIAKKRRDYFAAGTLVVWDVDLLSENIVRVYRASDPETPTIYKRGEQAEAEPAVPGWHIFVDDLFPPFR